METFITQLMSILVSDWSKERNTMLIFQLLQLLHTIVIMAIVYDWLKVFFQSIIFSTRLHF